MKTKTKNKWFIVIISIMTVIMVGLATGIYVLAASMQSVSSSISVTYTANKVDAYAGANWRVGHDIDDMKANYYTSFFWDDCSEMTTSDGENYIYFSSDEETTTKSLSPNQQIDLSSANKKCVAFLYWFTDASLTSPIAVSKIKATVEYVDVGNDDTNITIKAYTSDGDPTSSGYLPWDVEYDDLNDICFTLKGGDPGVLIIVSVDDTSKDATFTGSFNWTLSAIN